MEVPFLKNNNKIDATVIRETMYIAVGVVILSVLLESVFLIIGRWDITVLFGNLLGGFCAVINFFLMGITVQRALTKEEKEARDVIKLSQTLRMFMQLMFAAVGFLIPSVFNVIAVIVSLLFPRIAIAFRPAFNKRMEEKESE